MDFIYAFLVGGAICLVGQVLLDFAKLTPAHLMATFVVIGAVLDGFGLYDKLIKFAGAGGNSSYYKFWTFLITRGNACCRETRIYRDWYGYV